MTAASSWRRSADWRSNGFAIVRSVLSAAAGRLVKSTFFFARVGVIDHTQQLVTKRHMVPTSYLLVGTKRSKQQKIIGLRMGIGA